MVLEEKIFYVSKGAKKRAKLKMSGQKAGVPFAFCYR